MYYLNSIIINYNRNKNSETYLARICLVYLHRRVNEISLEMSKWVNYIYTFYLLRFYDNLYSCITNNTANTKRILEMWQLIEEGIFVYVLRQITDADLARRQQFQRWLFI